MLLPAFRLGSSCIFILGLGCLESPFFKLIYADQVSVCLVLFGWILLETIMCFMKIAASQGHREGFSLLFISHLFEVSL